jgi:hypothetical protein
MRTIRIEPLSADQIFALLDEFYKRGFTKNEMKMVVDIWWKVGRLTKNIKP